MSLALGISAHREIELAGKERFDAVAINVARKVEGRFDDYIAVLTGLRARFNSAELPTRAQFREYVAGLDLARNYPGFQTVNYAHYVAAGEKSRFEATLRRDPDLDPAVAAKARIEPSGERDGYFPLMYVEPMAGNENVLGRDLAAMPNRGNALEQARDTGGLLSSGRKISFAGRDSDIGLAMRLPVYRPHMPLDTVEQRRAAYLGSVGAGFSLGQMMQVIAGGDAATLRLRLADAGASARAVGTRVESRFVATTPIAESQLLYDSAGVSKEARATHDGANRVERTLAFDLGGRSWQVSVDQDEREVISRLDRALPWLTVLGGFAISTLLAGIVLSLTTGRTRAQALANAMTRDLRASQARLKLEYETARLLIGDGDPEAVIAQALGALCRGLGWDCAAIWSLREDGSVHCSAAWHGDGDPAVAQFIRISRSLTYRPDEGSLGRAWAGGDVVRIDTRVDRSEFTRDALAGKAGLAVGLVVPMVTAHATTALEFFSRDAHAAHDQALESMGVIALQIAQYEQRKQAERRLRFVAGHDPLTGLSNRATLQHEMARAITRSHRYQKRFAVMFMDLDRFKHINDTLGHGAGDTMIKLCAERLAALLRTNDTVARFGGDEFVLLVENLSAASDAATLAERVLACCAKPYLIDGRELHVSASIGVCVYPEDGDDAETLLKNADTAMYRAKERGGDTFRFYAAQMNAQGNERLVVENALRHAIDRGELELHYQPKMNLQSRRIVGVEALMRWRHPELGDISPIRFIPIAEETGLIEAMGKWALQKACADARSWRESGLPAVQVSVNLSLRQLNSPSLLADIRSILLASGLDPSQLELEITESAMMKNPEQAEALLHRIREMGVGLAIDDFGTGYSSLSYLRRFPLSTVKVDRSFINDIAPDADAQALIDGIITLAHGLRMKVVAEGVETADQLEYLRTHGCDEIQGYWLCKPVPAEQAAQFMARHLRLQFASPIAA